jgi:hypothetical protein
MSLDDLLREVIASGRLGEPFTASEATRAVSLDAWPLTKVQNYLARHCAGNLAATILLVERVSYGKYRLIYDGPREDGSDETPLAGPSRSAQGTTSGQPGEPKS